MWKRKNKAFLISKHTGQLMQVEKHTHSSVTMKLQLQHLPASQIVEIWRRGQ